MTEADTTERSREEVLEDLRKVRERAAYKTWGDGRIRDSERAQIRIRYMRLLVRAASEERRLLKDRDLDRIEARLERLEDEAERAAIGGVA